MKKKLVQHGNSKAIIIDKTILKLLNIEDEAIFEIKIEGKSIILTPVKNNKKKKRKISKDKKLQKAYEETMKQYEELFESLSKN